MPILDRLPINEIYSVDLLNLSNHRQRPDDDKNMFCICEDSFPGKKWLKSEIMRRWSISSEICLESQPHCIKSNFNIDIRGKMFKSVVHQNPQ